MDCDIVIPWGSDGNLGAAYNRAMKNATDWVCFIDHDILQVNPNWYTLLLNAISEVGRSAGFITATCNAIACPDQLRSEAPVSNDIVDHMRFAKRCETKYGSKPVQIDLRNMQIPFSGFMIATHKGAWRAAGGFKDGFLGVDNFYHMAITQAGYTSWLIPGLYMYHLYRTKLKWSEL
jgi:GT2 family glycosyltransferase